MSKILIDFSQTVIASVAAQQKEFSRQDPETVKDLVKHIALNQLLSLKRRHHGDVIICCDGRNYWRKKEFPWYKGHRKHSKASSTLDWTLIYETLNELIEELRINFPYIVLKVDGCEADDIIAVLCEYFDENELVHTGLIEEPNSVIICSTDGDLQQLQKFRNVQQWNNITKKMMVCKNPKQCLIDHIVIGDAGDNIPNLVTEDDWARARSDGMSVRARPFATSRLKSFYDKGIDACLTENERRNFKRNEKLVDLSMIPTNIKLDILNAYLKYEIKGSKPKVLQYLTSKRMKLLLQYIQEF